MVVAIGGQSARNRVNTQRGQLMTQAERIETEAAQWLVRLRDGKPAPSELAAFQTWSGANPRHRAAYLRLHAAWRRADRLERIRPFEGAVDPDLLLRAPLRRRAREGEGRRGAGLAARIRPAYAAAAFAAVVVLSVGAITWMRFDRADLETYDTRLGGLERIVLSDGSIIHLNTDSELRVRFTPARRQVALLRGEAHFEVASDARRPFEVEANGAIIRAVGTAFSVHLRGNDRVEVLVKEGRVVLDRPGASGDTKQTAAGPPGAALRMLLTGDRVMIDGAALRSHKLESDEVTRKLAWMEGKVWFEGDTLPDAAAELNRYNHRKLVIADPALKSYRVAGAFRTTDLESFLLALEQYTHEGRVRPVRSRDSNVIELRLARPQAGVRAGSAQERRD